MMEWHRFESELWETAAVLCVADGQALAIDPGITPGEVTRMQRTAEQAGARVGAVLVTHVHSDHTCGIGAFPEAEVAMGPLAAQEVASGAAARSARELAAEQGFDLPGEPRCDRVLVPGVAAAVGGFTVETLALPGHTDGGLAFRVRDAGVLAVGDYLSSYEFPFVYHSTAAYRASVATLADLLRSDPPRSVVSGHGPAHDAPAALAIAEADLEYLHALRAAVLGALESGAGREAAAQAGAEVEPPRPAGELGDQRMGNGRLQVEELIGAEN
jgi:hydroxyacylglutathione hydrolase